jgi:hypothetical protein
MTVLGRMVAVVVIAVVVSAILTLMGLSHGRPALIGTIAGVLVGMKLRSVAKANGTLAQK